MAFRPRHRTEYNHDAGTVTVSLTMTIEQFRVVNDHINPHVSLWDDDPDGPDLWGDAVDNADGPDGAITLNEIHDGEHIEKVTIKPDGAFTRAVLDPAHGGFRYYSHPPMQCGY